MEPFHGNQTARLSLQEYAAVSARLHQAGGAHPAIALAQLGIPEDAWRAAAAEWERLIDEELAGGSNALLTTFAARFVATRAAIGRLSARQSMGLHRAGAS